jgi:hypothetical protein
MDEKMTFSDHVDIMVAKAFAILELIQETFVGVLRSLYSEVSGLSKTGICKLRGELVLRCSC